VENGFSVIPIGFRSKRPAFDALKWAGFVETGENGESAPAWEALKARKPTEEELRLLFAGPRRNLGIVTGYGGLVVLDFDDRAAYTAWQAWAQAEGGIVARMSATTYRVFSARGVHVYMLVDEPIESYKLPAIDVKARWGYVLAPPSVHPNGHQYTAMGATVARCERLSDVFPFGKPAPIMPPMQAPISDPWEAASRAVECGGAGSVAAIKATMKATDLVPIARQDRGGAWALCPLHRDTNPSLRLYNDGGYHCFGCGAHGGDVIDLYAALHRLTNREAIAALNAC